MLHPFRKIRGYEDAANGSGALVLLPSHVASDLPDGRVLRLPDFQFDHDGRAVGPTAHDIDTPHVARDLPPHERETLLKGVQLVHELIFDVPLEANRCLDGLLDPVTKNRYVFVTNNTTWVAQTIADIYKSRWQIELFFKWIKQHLKVKRFAGRSKNAVMTQLWVAMCMYLLLAYLKFVMRLRWSLHQMLQVLQLNMFERRPLQDLFTTPSLPAPSGSQLSLAWS